MIYLRSADALMRPHAPIYSNLTAWANDGVLLLNTALTVRAGNAGSHSNKGWEQFTDKVIEIVDKYGGSNLPTDGPGKAGFGRGIVFMAWGAWAAKRVAKLDKVRAQMYCGVFTVMVMPLDDSSQLHSEKTPHTKQCSTLTTDVEKR